MHLPYTTPLTSSFVKVFFPMQIEVMFEFAAAHQLPNHPGRCQRMHGHNYKLIVAVAGEVDAHTGFVADFSDIENICNEAVLKKVDHTCFNDYLENPTAERIVQWMWPLLKGRLPGLCELRLFETSACAVVYRGP